MVVILFSCWCYDYSCNRFRNLLISEIGNGVIHKKRSGQRRVDEESFAWLHGLGLLYPSLVVVDEQKRVGDVAQKPRIEEDRRERRAPNLTSHSPIP